ncbi:MAG: hypothetical protein JRG73_13305 [Deltaproteobacteria bacterium]|nr:hypothetical protein [Deltaproteobacteria bacterium]MBW2307896.1 hypothetical protein [Deltaproteobacteria bacterium]
MLPQVHIAVSASLSIILFGVFHSTWAALSNFLVGVLLDLDHLVEYYRTKGFTLNPLKIYRFCGFAVQRDWPPRVFFWLHAYEYVLLTALVAHAVHYHPAAVGAFIGMTQHLLLDQIGNNVGPFSYFLSYRFLNGFRCNRILTDKLPRNRRR